MFRQGNRVWLRLGMACLLAIALGISVGCTPPKGTLTGSVKLKNGTAVTPGSVITIFGSDNKPLVLGETDRDGNYTIGGITVGEVKITVAPPDKLTQQIVTTNPPAGKGEAKKEVKIVPIPAKYGDVKTTPLKTNVEKGSHEFPITIE
ncbi:MAG: hypothetical protein C5B56_15615 [Proteobacteria bacterium]|nr:MAG: hypothetical protein C5B56_15615 [Pseudomonadota bacterium]